ncbi:hypothetical protein N7541_009486 [Penicillium brevicompactum]|uniref:Uncharacterized protein n=1 Tax=Penicillium brevicompactum TaxID=5074 RepID=A0A9W9QLM7_PENBR|nr:hypothetical protein N7541_009486 [Penicillium brevicompactum]
MSHLDQLATSMKSPQFSSDAADAVDEFCQPQAFSVGFDLRAPSKGNPCLPEELLPAGKILP